MKKENFKKYLYPPLFGLGVYLIIRLINDTLAGENHFTSAEPITLFIEMSVTIIAGYILYFLWMKWSKRNFHQFQNNPIPSVIFKGLAEHLLITVLLINTTIVPMTALTDDGLSGGDFTLINAIAIFIGLIWFFSHHLLGLMEVYAENKTQLILAEKAKSQAELAYLKNQVQPHFLFNALNTIYFQIEKSNIAARSTVEQLSEILRYGLYEEAESRVSLAKEIRVIMQYDALMQSRFGEGIKSEIKTEINTDTSIYPHLFLPLLENAYKYTLNPGGKISFTIRSSHEKTMASIQNNYQELPPSHRAGLGLENLRKRLALLYNGQAVLKITKDEAYFSVELTINHDTQ